MKLKITAAIVVVVILMIAFSGGFGSSDTSVAVPRPTVRPTKAWFDGGTLHNKTVAEWVAATDANRLATAGDWVATFTTFDDMNEARRLAEDLVVCVNGTAESGPDITQQLKAAEIAASCAILMDWELKD